VPAEDERAVLRFRGGEDAALERLHTYFWERDRLRSYKWTRNGLLGADYSSKFSPWLAVGALSPRSVHAEVRRYERERKKNVSTYWLIFELIWRDYFFFLAEKYGPRLFHLRGPMERHLPWREDREAFARWCEGRTGEPFIDANMKEIAATGFMSNRGRQNVVSYLARDLAVPWTWGAEYFEELLIDYDPASNWGNWTYNAGVGTDPRPDRYFDPKTQAQKYDPKGDYVRTWMSPGLGL
jgi:deoxyribodipyrimidine photo-lyase